jgi:acyl carrier protein
MGNTTMSHQPNSSESTPVITEAAERILAGIGADLLELDPSFGLDADLFGAGLDSMAIMQVILMVEEQFSVKIPDSMIKRETFSSARRIAMAVIAQRQVS